MDKDLGDVLDVIDKANRFLTWAMNQGWSDEEVTAVCNIILDTDTAIMDAAQYEAKGKLLS